MSHVQVPDALARICAETAAETSRREERTSVANLRAQIAERMGQPRGFENALRREAANARVGLIAEIKRASPSGGVIRPDFDPVQLARAYAQAGASCLSVLTDGPFFQGTTEHMQAARAAVDLPVLRKDFMLSRWQIFESRALGADCILLIMAALPDGLAHELEDTALDLGLDVLAEVHNAKELDRALRLETRLIGVNNRNLKTLQTDLQTTVDLASRVPSDRLVISESGIRGHSDVAFLRRAGAQGFLVGESLLRQPDVAAATRALLGSPG